MTAGGSARPIRETVREQNSVVSRAANRRIDMIEETQRAGHPKITDGEIQTRIDELIAELTPAEKAGQLHSVLLLRLCRRVRCGADR